MCTLTHTIKTNARIMSSTIILKVTTQHPMGISNRLTVVLQQELH